MSKPTAADVDAALKWAEGHHGWEGYDFDGWLNHAEPSEVAAPMARYAKHVATSQENP